MMSKVANAKKHPRQKWKKTVKCTEEQDNESTFSFQNCDSRQVFCIQMFSHQGWYLHKERETSILTLCMVNFDLTATSLFKTLNASVELRQHQSLSQRKFFSFS